MPNRRLSRVLLVCLLPGCLLAIAALRHSPKPVMAQAASAPVNTAAYAPTYTKEGDLVPPLQYREWIYLTTGLDMNYFPKSDPSMSTFDNVFVNPEAYRSFLATGTWPDKTVIVLEGRGASSKGSINKSGHFQSGGLTGLEIHVKDEARFPGKWAFSMSPARARLRSFRRQLTATLVTLSTRRWTRRSSSSIPRSSP